MTTREYLWVMTAQTQAPHGGIKIATVQDTIDWDEHDARQDAFWHCLGEVCEQLGCHARDAYVMFWSFEPNTLTTKET